MKKTVLSFMIFLGCLVLFASPTLGDQPKEGQAPAVLLPPAERATPDRIATLRDLNSAGGGLVAAGFERAIPEPIIVDFQSEALPASLPAPFAGGLLSRREDGSLVWALRLGVEGAFAVSVHLQSVALPEGVRLSVVAPGFANPKPFDMSAYGPEGDLWSPTVRGPYAELQLEFPAWAMPGGYMEVAGILEIVHPAQAGAPAPPAPEPTAATTDGAPQLLAPPAPTNLTATVTGLNTVALQWQYNSTKGKGFKIQRRLATSGSWAVIAKVALGSTAYTDSSVTPCQQYSYRVKSYTSSASSPPSNEAVITAGTPGNFSLTVTRPRFLWTRSRGYFDVQGDGYGRA